PVLRGAAAFRLARAPRRSPGAARVRAGQTPLAAEEPVLMRILGISAHYHDSAAALVVDGVPACSVQEERLSRRKNDASFPLSAIEWCLDRCGIVPDDLDAVVCYEKPMLKFERILTMARRGFPRNCGSFPRQMKRS